MKVFSIPEEVTQLTVDYSNFDFAKIQADEKTHMGQVKDSLIALGYKGKHTGKVLQIPHADGYAQYMLADGNPSCLIHLPYGDAWNSPNAEFLPKKEVLKRIEQQSKLADMFTRNLQ